MTWEMTSFLILGAVLLAGFAWYERSRPPAQVVALVAALAALAIAGRIAFAAFPNVKPTTDIVIFAGYALGGAPGFAVGALAALVSNFWFGQGPWTPWQMAGWGLCGVLGAALALGTRNAGRLLLAAVCGFAGILYGALLNFSLMATYGGDLSWEHFWVLEGRAVPFEVAHVLGNVVLALVAGPAMVRMLTRFRERFEWQRGGTGPEGPSRRPLGPAVGGGVAVLLLVLLFGALAPRSAEAIVPGSPDVLRGGIWLEKQQRPSGGFAADQGREAGAEMTAWAMLAFAAAGVNPVEAVKGGKTPVDFLRSHRSEIKDAGDVARTILALEAAGVDPRSFGGEDLVSRLLAERRQSGSYQGWPTTSAYAVLALRSAGSDATGKTVGWLRKVQGKDGGWGNEPGDPSSPEITGAVLQVLSPGSKASGRALKYLRKAKRPNGGYAPGNNLQANAQATAWVSQGLLAQGKDPVDFGPGKSSFAYLRDLQAGDGHFLQSPGVEASPVWVTADVLIPLAGHHLPIAAPPRQPKPKPAKKKSTEKSGGVAPEGETPSTTELPPEAQKFLEETQENSAGAASGGSAPSGGSGGAG
ncbi:MAG TPA: prenyltransferase/squalene oxidase repeat-containing protein, partial [Solirubrobacterales bacterium]|nr:prenyltransferase/squalene oxidase repeat-containing protein [Solirubrobacterales bacterium]